MLVGVTVSVGGSNRQCSWEQQSVLVGVTVSVGGSNRQC